MPVNRNDFIAHTAGNAFIFQAAVFVQRLIGLANNIFILYIGRHILYFFSDPAGRLIDHPVGRFDEAEVIDPRVSRQIRDQADVRAFRGLNRAHTAIVAVVHVPNLHGCAVTGQAAGTQRGKAALMGQLGQRVILIHELGQRRGTEKFLNRSSHRTDVNQGLWGNDIQILNGHAFTNDTLHTGETDAELVLQQLANAAHTAVAQVVNIIRCTDAVADIQQIADGCQHIIGNNGLWHKIQHPGLNFLFQLFALHTGFNNLFQDGEPHPFLYAKLFGSKAGILGKVVQINHTVTEHLDGRPFGGFDYYAAHTA